MASKATRRRVLHSQRMRDQSIASALTRAYEFDPASGDPVDYAPRSGSFRVGRERPDYDESTASRSSWATDALARVQASPDRMARDTTAFTAAACADIRAELLAAGFDDDRCARDFGMSAYAYATHVIALRANVKRARKIVHDASRVSTPQSRIDSAVTTGV